jgi:LEA14-like dessication related protein
MFKWILVYPIFLACLITGCATLSGRDSPDVRVVGLEPLPSEGLELRFELKMRVINPNDTSIAFDGLAVKLDLDGRGLASGVSDAKGEIARFGEQVLTVPVSISAFSAVRQLLSRAGEDQNDQNSLKKPISYSLSGKLGGGPGVTNSVRFSTTGELNLFSDTGTELQAE